jgi:hypothetical protein
VHPLPGTTFCDDNAIKVERRHVEFHQSIGKPIRYF